MPAFLTSPLRSGGGGGGGGSGGSTAAAELWRLEAGASSARRLPIASASPPPPPPPPPAPPQYGSDAGSSPPRPTVLALDTSSPARAGEERGGGGGGMSIGERLRQRMPISPPTRREYAGVPLHARAAHASAEAESAEAAFFPAAVEVAAHRRPYDEIDARVLSTAIERYRLSSEAERTRFLSLRTESATVLKITCSRHLGGRYYGKLQRWAHYQAWMKFKNPQGTPQCNRRKVRNAPRGAPQAMPPPPVFSEDVASKDHLRRQAQGERAKNKELRRLVKTLEASLSELKRRSSADRHATVSEAGAAVIRSNDAQAYGEILDEIERHEVVGMDETATTLCQADLGTTQGGTSYKSILDHVATELHEVLMGVSPDEKKIYTCLYKITSQTHWFRVNSVFSRRFKGCHGGSLKQALQATFVSSEFDEFKRILKNNGVKFDLEAVRPDEPSREEVAARARTRSEKARERRDKTTIAFGRTSAPSQTVPPARGRARSNRRKAEEAEEAAVRARSASSNTRHFVLPSQSQGTTQGTTLNTMTPLTATPMRKSPTFTSNASFGLAKVEHVESRMGSSLADGDEATEPETERERDIKHKVEAILAGAKPKNILSDPLAKDPLGVSMLSAASLGEDSNEQDPPDRPCLQSSPSSTQSSPARARGDPDLGASTKAQRGNKRAGSRHEAASGETGLVQFVDCDGDLLSFTTTFAGLVYSVNGEERPASRCVVVSDAGDRIDFPDIARAVQMPEDAALRTGIITNLRDMCNAGNIGHNIAV